MKIKNKRNFVATFLSSFSIGMLLALIVITPTLQSLAGYPSGATPVFEHPISDYSYLVWRDGSTYYAKNGSVGTVDFSSSSALTLLDAVETACEYGDKIVIASGTYVLSAVWTITQDGLWIQGYNRGTVLQFGTNAYLTISAPYYGIINVYANDVTLSNFEIDGNYANNAAGTWMGLRVYGNSQNCTIDTLWIHDIMNNGIELRGEFAGSLWFVEHCTIRNCEIWNMMNTAIPGDGSNPIACFYAKDFTIQSNRLHDYGELGINLYTNSSYGNVVGNTLWNGYTGIELEGTQNFTCTSNLIFNMTQIGIYIGTDNTGDARGTHWGTVNDNTVIGCNETAGSGIFINGGSANQYFHDITIQGNIIKRWGWSNNDQGGIKVYGASNYVEGIAISGNEISDCYDFGIWLLARNCSANDNVVRDCGNDASGKQSGIILDGGWLMADGNFVENCYFGISTRLTNSYNQTVSNNYIIGCEYAGIHLNSKHVIVRDNTIIKNTRGVNIAQSYETIIYNYFEDNTNTITGNGVTDTIRYNIGYATENSGTQIVQNGENIAHGLVATPLWASVTCLNGTYDGKPLTVWLNYTGFSSSNIVPVVYWLNGTVITDDVIYVAWEARTWTG